MDFDVDLPDLTCLDLFLISVERVTNAEKVDHILPSQILPDFIWSCYYIVVYVTRLQSPLCITQCFISQSLCYVTSFTCTSFGFI